MSVQIRGRVCSMGLTLASFTAPPTLGHLWSVFCVPAVGITVKGPGWPACWEDRLANIDDCRGLCW